MRHIKIELKKSLIGVAEKHRLLVRGLGLRHIRQKVEVVDTPSTRGIVEKIQHLIAIEVHEGEPNKR